MVDTECLAIEWICLSATTDQGQAHRTGQQDQSRGGFRNGGHVDDAGPLRHVVPLVSIYTEEGDPRGGRGESQFGASQVVRIEVQGAVQDEVSQTTGGDTGALGQAWQVERAVVVEDVSAGVDAPCLHSAEARTRVFHNVVHAGSDGVVVGQDIKRDPGDGLVGLGGHPNVDGTRLTLLHGHGVASVGVGAAAAEDDVSLCGGATQAGDGDKRQGDQFFHGSFLSKKVGEVDTSL